MQPDTLQADRLVSRLTHPVRLTAALALSVFALEVALMFGLEELPAMARWMNAVLDAGILALVVSLALWRLVVQPLRTLLHKEQLLAHTILKTASEGIVTIDERGRIVGFNRAAERMFGYRAAEVRGRNIALLMPRGHADRHDSYMEAYRRTGQKRVVDTTRQVDAVRATGEIFPVEMSMSEVNAGGQRVFTAIVRDITERRRMEDTILKMAHYDALTGLPNRTLFFDRLSQETAAARRRGERLALLYVDLDGFKHVNDAYGHHAGDLLLKTVGERLTDCIRASDTVGRLGGDEFALILPGVAGRQDADLVAEKIVHACNEPFILDDAIVSAGASVGVGLFPDDGAFVEDVMKIADERMYAAKRASKALRAVQERAEAAS